MSTTNKNLTLEEVHKATLKLMTNFHEFCESNGLTYYLAYGTLLGCIRHNGFIPWDDDVDVWMMREDYNRLIKLFREKEYHIDHIQLCTRESCRYYDYPIARYSDLTYRYILSSGIGNTPDMGTFIDIYPLDSFENSDVFMKTYKKIAKLNWQYAVYCNPNVGNPLKKAIKLLSKGLTSIMYRNDVRKAIDERTDEIIKTSAVKGDMVGVPCWFTTGNTLLNKAWFASRMIHKYENTSFYIPENYHEILTKIYGDYMTPPPEGKRVQYHNYEITRRD